MCPQIKKEGVLAVGLRQCQRSSTSIFFLSVEAYRIAPEQAVWTEALLPSLLFQRSQLHLDMWVERGPTPLRQAVSLEFISLPETVSSSPYPQHYTP